MIRTVIIEDEKHQMEFLADSLKESSLELQLVANANSMKDGVKIIRQYQPDLVFLDIELGDGTGFDVLEQIGRIDFELIFVTAYKQYAIDAIKKSNCQDYILKPYDIEDIQAAISKVKTIIDKKDPLLKKLYMPHHKVIIPNAEGFKVEVIGNIMYCKASTSYTEFHLIEPKMPLIASQNLLHYEKLLSPYNFVRVHRQYLINFEYISAYRKGNGGSVEMSDGSVIPVSSLNKKKLMTSFENL